MKESSILDQIAMTKRKAKPVDAKNPFVNMLLNMSPGKKVLIEVEMLDCPNNLNAAITITDHKNKQAFAEHYFKVNAVSSVV